MATKERKYLVSFKLKGAKASSVTVKAHDAACALGVVLDELGEDGEGEFEWLLIRSVKPTPKRTPVAKKLGRPVLPLPPAELPPEIMKAFYEGLVGNN